MIPVWESTDKTVSKAVLKAAPFSKKPTEGATCDLIIENILVTGITKNDLKDKLHSEILNDEPQKTIVIGNANCGIDRQIERAIEKMLVGEKSVVTISMPSVWDGNCKFEVTLVKFDPFKPIWEWTPEEKYAIALKHKEAGVELFKQSRHIDAFHRFSKACKIIITLEPIPDLELEEKLEKDLNDLRLILYNNMAKCQYNQKNYEHTISLCSKVLEKDENNVKALYKRGMAYGDLRDIEHAVQDLKKATGLAPTDPLIKRGFVEYNQKWKEANKRSDDMVRRMFKV